MCSGCREGKRVSVRMAVCSGVGCGVPWHFGKRRGKNAKNMVGYDIKASGMWTEYLKYDLCENHCLVLFCIVLNSFGRKNLCIVEVTAK